jgi:hypothetical protein
MNEQLFQAASAKADDMLEKNYFAHTSPSGITPWFWFEKEDYDYKFAGENLAINFSTAEDQQKAWMESETHRKNILDPNYRQIGLAIKKGFINNKLTTITVQEFGTPMVYVEPSVNKNIAKNSFLPKIVDLSLGEKVYAADNSLSKIIINDQKKIRVFDFFESIAVVAILVIIFFNSMAIIWVTYKSFFINRKKELKINPTFSLYDISQDEYLEFLKKFSMKRCG